MFDAILTYLIVALAAAFVIWKILLPVRVRTTLRARLAGDQVPCAPDAETAGCEGGCPGCGLAKPAARK
jgi:multidrug resistance efflux pump